MSSEQYITLEPAEKEQLQEAKARDPRFAEPSRITTVAYLALLAQERLQEWEGEA